MYLDYFQNLYKAIYENKRKPFLELLKFYFEIRKNILISNAENKYEFESIDQWMADLLIYVIREKYDILLSGVDLFIVKDINETVLLRTYEEIIETVLHHLSETLRLNIDKRFKEKFYEMQSLIGPPILNNINFVYDKLQVKKIVTFNNIDAFAEEFLKLNFKIIETFSDLKRKRGQPNKYTDEMFEDFENKIKEEIKQSRAAKDVLKKYKFSEHKSSSFIKLYSNYLIKRVHKQSKRNGI